MAYESKTAITAKIPINLLKTQKHLAIFKYSRNANTMILTFYENKTVLLLRQSSFCHSRIINLQMPVRLDKTKT